MGIQKIGDSILVTGNDDIYKFLMGNGRDNYDKTCSFCKHEGVNEKRCEECSIQTDPDGCCSCHICPPCSYCVNNGFEVSPYLINYERPRKGGKRIWECYKGNKEVFEKLKQLEADGLKIVAEILTTGEIAIYIESEDFDEAVDITTKADFKEAVNKMILKFSLEVE